MADDRPEGNTSELPLRTFVLTPHQKLPVFTATILALGMTIFWAIYPQQVDESFIAKTIWTISVLFVLARTSALAFNAVFGKDEDLQPIRLERRELQARMSEDKHADVMDTIYLSLNQLSEYYAISKAQARGSFRVSVAAMILGFITLISGVWLFFFQSSDTRVQTVATISAVGGVLSQFLAASYFYLYKTTIAQMSYFYDRLVSLQDTMLSVRLCEGIDDKPCQYALKEQVVIALLAHRSRLSPSGPVLDPGRTRPTPAPENTTAPATPSADGKPKDAVNA